MISLEGIYRWAESRGYVAQDEHILIEGLPTQFIPAPNPLAREAVGAAAQVEYQGVAVRVVRSLSDMASVLSLASTSHLSTIS